MSRGAGARAPWGLAGFLITLTRVDTPEGRGFRALCAAPPPKQVRPHKEPSWLLDKLLVPTLLWPVPQAPLTAHREGADCRATPLPDTRWNPACRLQGTAQWELCCSSSEAGPQCSDDGRAGRGSHSGGKLLMPAPLPQLDPLASRPRQTSLERQQGPSFCGWCPVRYTHQCGDSSIETGCFL